MSNLSFSLLVFFYVGLFVDVCYFTHEAIETTIAVVGEMEIDTFGYNTWDNFAVRFIGSLLLGGGGLFYTFYFVYENHDKIKERFIKDFDGEPKDMGASERKRKPKGQRTHERTHESKVTRTNIRKGERGHERIIKCD
jgi:hypothetical protein